MGQKQSGFARDIIVVEQKDSTLKSSKFMVKIHGKKYVKDRDAKIVGVATDGRERFRMSVNQLRPTSDRLMSSRHAAAPTKEELASLNLQYGKNKITFTLNYERRGIRVQSCVEGFIFLWKWDTKIVVTDIDGTITKSNLHNGLREGVVTVFSSIKKNGYAILYLSGRPSSEISSTRKLLSTAQDGKLLPDGPVIHASGGYFRALYRFVLQWHGTHFKTPYLKEVKNLFPQFVLPFSAGFGNTTTDAKSYDAVDISYKRIFHCVKDKIVVRHQGTPIAIYPDNYKGYAHFIDETFPKLAASESAAAFQRDSRNPGDNQQMPPRSRLQKRRRIHDSSDLDDEC